MATVKLPPLSGRGSRPLSRSTGRSSFSTAPSAGVGFITPADDTPSPPESPRDAEENGSADADSAPGGVVAPPSLSHLVSASLANAAAHERAILRWTRDIQREMDAYKATLASKNAAAKERRRREAPAATCSRAHIENRRAGLSDTSYWSSGAGFMRDDMQSVPARGRAARFYPTNLVKVDAPSGSLSARDASPRRGRRHADSRGAATARNRKTNITAATTSGPLIADAPADAATEAAQLYAVYGAPLTSTSLITPPPPESSAALQSLPPGLNASELQPVLPGGTDVDESAAFRSPAVYLDLKMRQLFHPASAADTAAPTQTASQKAHVMAHLLDTLGELVEPDSTQAFAVLSETIKDLMLSSEYKNLISVGPNGGVGRDTTHATSSAPAKSAASIAVGAASRTSGASLATLQKEMSRRERAKWDRNGHPRRPHHHATDTGKTLVERLADGSLENGGGSTAASRPMTKAEKRPAFDQPQSGDSQSAAAFLHEFEARRKGVPSIAFEGDATDAARDSLVAENGVVPYRSTALSLPASVFANLRQIPASFLEVAWSLKDDVAAICARLEYVDLATRNQALELARLDQEQTFLQSWNQKKTLQMQVYQRSEINLSSEIILLKNLLVDLKEEFETLTEETILLEEDYLAHGIVFGGSFAMEEFRFEEEHRNYPLELLKKRRELDATLTRIDAFKKDLLDIHTERDLLLTRIEVLEQAVNMMHHDEDEDDEANGDEEDDETRAAKAAKAAQKERDALDASRQVLDPNGYPFHRRHPDDLCGRGSSNLSVPSFLRFDGFFPNLHFSKQEVEVRIKEIWSLKTVADEKTKQVGGQRTGLREYFEAYLHKRFQKGVPRPTPTTTTSADGATSDASLSLTHSAYVMQEFVLNFFTTLEHHALDQDFLLFLKVIHGDLHEDHHPDQMKMIANFKDAIFRWDLAEHVARGEMIDGRIGKEQILRGLKQFFPHKSEQHMSELVSILERDCITDGQVDARKILSSDDLESTDGDDLTECVDATSDAAGSDNGEPPSGLYTSNFLECIRHQYLLEIEQFVARIRADLYALYRVRQVEYAKAVVPPAEGVSSPSTAPDTRLPFLTAYDIRHVLRACDPNRSTEDLTDLLKRGCNEPYLSKDTEVQIDKFMTNLIESGLVHTTDHWRRIPARILSLDSSASRAAALAEEERKAAAADLFAMPIGSKRSLLKRRASMEDEAQYFAARAGAVPNQPGL